MINLLAELGWISENLPTALSCTLGFGAVFHWLTLALLAGLYQTHSSYEDRADTVLTPLVLLQDC